MCALAALAGCTAPSGGTEREPGPAAAEISVVRGDRSYPLTVKITKWEVRRHPQLPKGEDAVHFSYRTSKKGMLPEALVELAACAVDSRDVVLLCQAIAVDNSPGEPRVEAADSWMGPGTGLHLSDTARVVLLPDQLRPGVHAGDPKDSDGYVPPSLPAPGDRLRMR
ncbi:hypothetical protein AQI88_41430 [Streptomyces cellostaticus]|uniref:Uncharacterized protein n=1 Tax=Streptomyces cellostaticus TaxID=67285 RepID=A0A101N413_9ACTN|nr:hypothetical protein [Streptomyces cellostaticus]KUM86206.1 hypothetical protein AQI88_41430 [Streptomyces cellostaticus]